MYKLQTYSCISILLPPSLIYICDLYLISILNIYLYLYLSNKALKEMVFLIQPLPLTDCITFKRKFGLFGP